MAVLEVEIRGSEKPAKLRSHGIVPMALIEHGEDTRLIQAPLSDVRKVLAHTSGVGMFELQIKGQKKKHTVVVKQIDQAIVGQKLLHLSVMAINKDEVLVMDVGIVAVGTPEAVKSHEAVLGHPTTSVKLKGKATDLPGHIEVDVSELQVPGTVTAGQVQLPEGIELASSPDAVIFSLQPLRAVKEETTEEAEAPTQPEVIGASDSETES